MPNAVHRTTKEYRLSASEPSLGNLADWILMPDMSAVDQGGGFLWPSKYWVITGDVVTLADQAARDAIDAAEVDSRRDTETDRLDDIEDILRAAFQLIIQEFNELRALHGLSPRTLSQMKTALRNKLGT